MDVRFVAPDLERLDALKSEAIAIPVFEDERPLRGALGLIDWRLCGSVSKLILRGRLSGREGETLLLPARPRLTFEKLFVFGVGSRTHFDERALEVVTERMLSTLTRVRVRASVMALPGRALDLVSPARAMEVFLSVAANHPEHDEVTLIEMVDAARAMEPIVEREKRRARANAGSL